MSRIKHLILPEAQPFKVADQIPEQAFLWGLSHINLLVGANNSGKSRFMRLLLSHQSLQFIPEKRKESTETLIARDHELQELASFLNADDKGKWDLVGKWVHLISVQERTPYNADRMAFAADAAAWMRNRKLKWRTRSQAEIIADIDEVRPGLSNRIPWPLRLQEGRSKTATDANVFKRLYIPVLRGLRRVASAGKEDAGKEADCFADATLRDYKELKEGSCQVFTGQTLYEDVRKLLCGKHEERKRIAAFENYLSETFFQRQSVALIPHHQAPFTLHIKIGDEPQRPIHELGDGIQAIIAITFRLFTAPEEPMLVGIEEPELNLHPGMQRILLSALRCFDHCQFFIATHSNHFLDLTLESDDVSVYTFEKQLQEGNHDERNAIITITPVSHGDSRTLQLLGVCNSSVFLVNCTIWVEGITDRRYFSHYFQLYQNHLKEEAERAGQKPPMRFSEDLHFAFVEYGGSNITHWSWLDDTPDPIEVDRLCGRLMLIADNDNAVPGTRKAERHQKLQKRLEERFALLQSREVENLISPEIMRKYLESLGVTEGESNDLVQSWEDYRGQELGRWIDDILARSAAKNKDFRKHAAESGTVKDKGRFAEDIIRLTVKFEQLTDETQCLCKRLYKFIEQNQQRVAGV